MYIYLLLIVSLFLSCNKRESDGRNPYCEFVDGKYTFDIDFRRTLFYKGTDFDFKYYSVDLQESDNKLAEYVILEGIGHFYDEQTNRENNISISYSALFKLPKDNEIVHVKLNVLTTLEKERVFYLVNSGSDYIEAINKVRDEVKLQVNNSSYFNSFDYDNNAEFSEIKINNYFLYVYTSSIANMISNKLMNSEDKTSVVDIWNDYIMNYALTGDLMLKNLEPHDLNSQYFINNNYNREIDQLQVSVCNYNIPFLGGIPQERNNKIFYGVNINSYKNKIKGLEKMSIRGINHKYKSFTFNGYIDISADILVDSINYKEDLRIAISKLNSKKIDTTIVYGRSEINTNFSTQLWFNQEDDYNIKIILGRDSILYNVSNRLIYNK